MLNSGAAIALGGFGTLGLDPLVEVLEGETGLVHAQVLRQFLDGMYSAHSGWSADRTRSTSRAWLQACVGPDWDSGAAPLPKSASKELRWIVSEAARRD